LSRALANPGWVAIRRLQMLGAGDMIRFPIMAIREKPIDRTFITTISTQMGYGILYITATII